MNAIMTKLDTMMETQVEIKASIASLQKKYSRLTKEGIIVNDFETGLPFDEKDKLLNAENMMGTDDTYKSQMVN